MHLLGKIRRRWAFTMTAVLILAVLIGGTRSARLYAQAGSITYNAPVSGKVVSGSPQDWVFTGMLGDVVSVEITRTDGDLQPSIRLLNTEGETLFGAQAAANQDRLMLVDIRISQTAAYTLRISAEENTSGAYTLLVKQNTPPVATAATPTVGPAPLFRAVTYGTPVLGAIGGTTFEQVWRFDGTAGDVIDIEMQAITGDLDSYFTLFSPLQDFIGANDSANGGKDAGLYAVTLPQTGPYTIVARQGGGARANTSGQYKLTVTLRTPKLGADNTALSIGGSLSGRLTRAAPIAQYTLTEGGLVAFKVELSTLHRIPSLRILDSTGTQLVSHSGPAPLIFSVALPPKGPFYLQVSTDAFDTTADTAFVLSGYKIASVASSLRSGEAQFSAGGSANEQRWFFIAQAGDIVRVRLAADRGALDRTATIRGPGDIVLFSGNLNPQFDQVLSLPIEGVYQIALSGRTAGNNIEAAVAYDLLGSAGAPYDQFVTGAKRGALGYDQNVTGSLSSPEIWYLDVSSATTISLQGRGDSGQQRLALTIRAPDNTILAARAGQGTVNVVAATLPQAGRYLITAFDPTARGGTYTLRMEDAGGGKLTADRAVKGVMLPTSAYREWAITAPAGSLINANLTTRTPGAWVPRLYAIDPAGEVIGEAFPNTSATTPGDDGRNSVRLFGVQATRSGVYRIIVAGQVTASFASYELTVAAQPLFNTVFSAQAVLGTADRPDAPLTYPTAPPVPRQPPQVADLLLPTAPRSAAAAEATFAPPNTLVRGEIKGGAFQQAWRISAPRGNTINIQVSALAGSLGPQLTLLDGEGNFLAEQLRGPGTTTTLAYRSVAGGEYIVIVRVGLAPVKFLLYYTTDLLRSTGLNIKQGIALVYGQTAIGEMLDPAQVDTYYFYGSLNDVVSARVAALTGRLALTIQILTIDGAPLTGSAGDALLEQVRLAQRAIYAIRVSQVAGKDAQTGRYHLFLSATSVSRSRNRLGGLINEGQAVTGALGIASTEDVWLFNGHAGQQPAFTLSALDPQAEPTPLTFAIQDTAGNSLAVQTTLFSRDSAAINTLTLPLDGIYRVLVYGGTTTAGGYRLTWNADSGQTAPGVIAYGQTVGGLFTAKTNASTWNFIGSAGDVVSIFTRQVSGDPALGSLQILAENGLVLATALDSGNGYGARVENVTLPFSGSYTILVANPRADFSGTAVYNLGLNLEESTVRNLGGTLLSGQPMLGAIDAGDPIDLWIFSGTAGQKFSLQVQPREGGLAPLLRVRDRAGTILAEARGDAGSGAGLPDFTLPANGAYTVEVSSASATIGRYLIVLDAIEAPISPLAAIQYGRTVPGLIADDRPTDEHVFSGAAGDRITISVSREPGSLLALTLDLYDPSGQLLARADAMDQDIAEIAAFTLTTNGQYRLVVTRLNAAFGKTAGRFNLTLNGDRSAPTIRGRLATGQRGIGRLGDNNPIERWEYVGKQDEVIGVISTATSGDLDTVLTVLDPTGDLIANNDDPPGGADTNARLSGLRLPMDGTYTIIIARVGTRAEGSAGNYEINVSRVYTFTETPPPDATLGYGDRITGTVGVNQPTARYVFAGEAEDIINVSLLHNADDAPPQLSIRDLTGTSLVSGSLQVGQTTITGYQLPARGSYVIYIQFPVNARLAYAPFTLSLALARSAERVPIPGGALTPDQSAIGTLGGIFSRNQWLFRLISKSQMTFNLIPLSGNIQPTVTLVNPLGQVQFSQRLGQGAGAITFSGLPITQDGIYTLIVTAKDGQAGTYRLFYRTDTTDSSGDSVADVLSPNQVVTRSLNDITPVARFHLAEGSPERVTIRSLVTSGDLIPSMRVIDGSTGQVTEAQLEKTLLGWSLTITDIAVPRDPKQLQVVLGRQGAGAGTVAVGYSARGLSVGSLDSTPIAYGQTVATAIVPTLPQIYQIDGQRGDALNLVALSELTGRAPMLTLQTSSGDRLKTVVPSGSESSLQGFVLPANDRYILEVTSDKATAYTLTIQRRQDQRPVVITGRQLVVDGNQENGILPGTLFNYWVIQGKQGSMVKLTLKPVNSLVRLDLSVFTPDGYFLTSATATKPGDPISLGPFTLPQDGPYQVVVGRWLGELGRSTGRYSILLQQQSP
jgi:hypothetical protein